MATLFGTLQTTDTLQSLRVSTGTIAQYGEDRAFDSVNAALVAHNAILADLLGPYCEVTTNRLRRVGGPIYGEMEEVDQYGVTDSQKIAAGANIGFPLRKYGRGLQWTRDYFRIALASEFAAQVTDIFTSDVRLIQRLIKRAIFYPVNYTYYDRYIDNVQLPVKALQNPDATIPVPVGPNGEIFPTTHNHYLGIAGGSFVSSDLDNLIRTVVEHFNGGAIYVYINQAQEAPIRTFIPNFTPLMYPNIMQATTAQSIDNGGSLNPVTVYNRQIGVYNGAEVWVKPWVPAGYMFCYMSGQPKPLCIRLRGTGPGGAGGLPEAIIAGTQTAGTGNGDLELVYEMDAYPLRAREYRREIGVSVYNRINGAVLYTGGTTYVAPVIS